MATKTGHLDQIEGQWDELVRNPHQFAGRRVRVTVLSDEISSTSSVPAEIRRWLAEGEALEIAPLKHVGPNVFGDGFVEKFRKQGLVL